jgi:hypothetical protein
MRMTTYVSPVLTEPERHVVDVLRAAMRETPEELLAIAAGLVSAIELLAGEMNQDERLLLAMVLNNRACRISQSVSFH